MPGPRKSKTDRDYWHWSLCPWVWVQAVSAVREIRRIKAYSRSAEDRTNFCAEMEKVLGIEVSPTRSGKEVLEGADIVITATSGNTIVLEGDWLSPGMLVMSLATGEFDERTVQRSRVFLAATDQVLDDSPPRKPFSSLIASGKFKREDVAAELHEVVTGKKPGRVRDDEIILFESPGMGILDAGIAHWIYGLAREQAIGTELPFGRK